jgi:hypothetical protein
VRAADQGAEAIEVTAAPAQALYERVGFELMLIGPEQFGFGQAVGHGLVFNHLAKDRYSPGFLASLLLHVPIGITYLHALLALARVDEQPLSSTPTSLPVRTKTRRLLPPAAGRRQLCSLSSL